jgi:two-component system sensor histidine kinase HydH
MNRSIHKVRRVQHVLGRLLLPVVIVTLPLILLLSSLRTLHELDEQKAIYLRSRVGTIAGRLENLRPAISDTEALDTLAQGEPGLLGLEFISRSGPQDAPFLQPIWDGEELFRTESMESGGQRVFRAYVPFHSSAGLTIARIDFDPAAADFLVTHGRHNVIVASLGGLGIVLFALYAIWATRRASRLELRQLELEHLAQLGKMSAVLAHEIRNPLGTIKGFAQLIGERANDSVKALIEPILGETERLETLVKGLLLYGRPPAPVPRPAKCEEILELVETNARQLIGQRDIGLVVGRPAFEWRTDPGLVQQLLLNLVRNAVEALGDQPGGEIRVEARRDGAGKVTISVIDNGPGFSQEATSRMFEPFFTTKSLGTGLGLAITRKLVQSLGGTLTIRPAAPRGTAAVVTLGAL